PEGYAEANELLGGSSRRFNLADMREDSQLGLIVVATIAQRHNLKVTLRPSPYNGTQAIIVFPPETIDTTPVTPPAVPLEPARPAPAELEAPPVTAPSAPAESAPAAPATSATGATALPAAPRP